MKRPLWIKLWTEEWLDGSIREQLTPEERSVWADLLALAGRSRHPGLIQAGNDTPYSCSYLASRFVISEELLERTLGKCEMQGRIKQDGKGITIVNWEKYQAKYAEEETKEETREKTRQPKRTKQVEDISPKEYLQKYGKGANR